MECRRAPQWNHGPAVFALSITNGDGLMDIYRVNGVGVEISTEDTGEFDRHDPR